MTTTTTKAVATNQKKNGNGQKKQGRRPKIQDNHQLTVRDISKATGLSVGVIRYAIRKGDLKGYRTGKSFVVFYKDFKRFNTKENLKRYRAKDGNFRDTGGTPKRYPDCRHYMECLSDTATKTAKMDETRCHKDKIYFSCVGCGKYDRLSDDELLPTHHEMLGIYRLWGEVFGGVEKKEGGAVPVKMGSLTKNMYEIAKLSGVSFGSIKKFVYNRDVDQCRNKTIIKKISLAIGIDPSVFKNASTQKIKEIFVNFNR